MKKFVFIVGGAVSLIACSGATGSSSKVMTSEERLEAQLAEAEKQRELEDSNRDRYDEAATTDEEQSKFDEEAATHEMKRAALNAVDCPNTFEKDQLGAYAPGKATVTLTFENNGGVKGVSVSSPYSGTPVGDCIERAMGTAHVELFSGPEVVKTWELELLEPKKPEPAKKK